MIRGRQHMPPPTDVHQPARLGRLGRQDRERRVVELGACSSQRQGFPLVPVPSLDGDRDGRAVPGGAALVATVVVGVAVLTRDEGLAGNHLQNDHLGLEQQQLRLGHRNDLRALQRATRAHRVLVVRRRVASS